MKIIFYILGIILMGVGTSMLNIPTTPSICIVMGIVALFESYSFSDKRR